MAMRRSDAEGLKNTLEGVEVRVVEVYPEGEIRLWTDPGDDIRLQAVPSHDPALQPEIEIWIDHHLDR
jgi:hypothetical protein